MGTLHQLLIIALIGINALTPVTRPPCCCAAAVRFAETDNRWCAATDPWATQSKCVCDSAAIARRASAAANSIRLQTSTCTCGPASPLCRHCPCAVRATPPAILVHSIDLEIPQGVSTLDRTEFPRSPEVTRHDFCPQVSLWRTHRHRQSWLCVWRE